MKIGRNGMVKISDAKATGLPVFDYRKSDICPEAERYTGDIGDLLIENHLRILGLLLTEEEKIDKIEAFVIYFGHRGALPLYSLLETYRRRS